MLPAVLQFMQQEKGIHRIEALVEEGNVASSKVLKKMGFEFEGRMRDCEVKMEAI